MPLHSKNTPENKERTGSSNTLRRSAQVNDLKEIRIGMIYYSIREAGKSYISMKYPKGDVIRE
jgi:hypothetical protein